MDEQQIAMHQFMGYVLNHVPEYKPFYQAQLIQDESDAPLVLSEGVACFLMSAWKEREERGRPSGGDTFARMAEALEMGLRAQNNDMAELIARCLHAHISREGLEQSMMVRLGPCTQAWLKEAGEGKG